MKTIEEMRKELWDSDCPFCCSDDCQFGCYEFCSKYNGCTVPDELVADWHKLRFAEQYITNDPVNHPSHYTKGKIEVADFIADQKLNFDRGNAVKYVCRAGSKDPDKEIQDLEKAIWYINHEIKTLKGDA